MKKSFIPALSVITVLAFSMCKPEEPKQPPVPSVDALASDYVRLALNIGQYDEAFVDAYYGPDSLKPTGEKLAAFPKDQFLGQVQQLSTRAREIVSVSSDSIGRHRAAWMAENLIAFDQRIRIFSGEYRVFDEESRALFGVSAPKYQESYFTDLINELDSILPGKGNVQDRFQKLANRFVIPKEKLDTVFKTCIAECRKRTLEHYKLPEGESFELEFVTNKSWNGYNWYKGNYQSLIQINTDLNIFIDRAIDVGSHESYPGHHVYNMLLEKNLYRDKGYVEVSVYPLFSPQSLIAEGTANYGIDVVFPGNEKARYAAEVLLPLAGLDTAGIATYFKAQEIKTKLNYVRNEVARLLLPGGITEEIAIEWLQKYGLYNTETAAKSVSFIKTYRSYVINYNYGLDLAKEYIESRGGTADSPEKRWQIFGELLSKQVMIGEFSGK